MKTALIDEIILINPWLKDQSKPYLQLESYIPRIQTDLLFSPEWDKFCTVLLGPRQAGKTTLGLFLCQKMIEAKRFQSLLYLNCDYDEIRQWMRSAVFIQEAVEAFHLESPIIFLDEVQRLENPGLLLKTIVDLKLPIKLMATGSSQLEIKSKVREHLTGRNIEAIILPLSAHELGNQFNLDDALISGSYPQICLSQNKKMLLAQLYKDYIQKDIIEILKVGKPDTIQKLMVLLAHSAGQQVNYNQLSIDCGVSIHTVQNYLHILEETYVIKRLSSFVGNKRTEITSNPVYYFLDCGFRNQALKNFSTPESRTDIGLLVQNLVFSEIYKYLSQAFLDFDIHYWRTKGGAEVDFVLYKNAESLIPIEAKYRNINRPTVSRGFRSFIQAYQPKQGIFITKNYKATIDIDGCAVSFMPLEYFCKEIFTILKQ